ncbi:hypothetical protein HHK36_025885 [Tetracentron sinense]|uniref:Two-component response regulator n=1 Tax=Tetracentron sinense TaxID=13715 RepID=A0A835D601_TETSI|nr:hypothetical protein HHK36_025885 [Tetracentron sinense]
MISAVTTTNQAITALEMLRENRNNFDLVISDVHMPDMDGFKLLELVGLEMDLPVIMLSAYSDRELVMKGITHGACDYLLKPIRIEELKNIWQHVIRRKKFDSKDRSSFDNQEKPHHGTGEGGQGPTETGNADQDGKLNRKRKDQGEDEDEECEENGHENEDPSTQKKPRVVWSVELHRKFVAAVNQLGVDRAVPKRILDMMNVEGLTRENVASHLQAQKILLFPGLLTQANMVAALGGKDPSYLHMGSLDGFGDFHALAGSGHLSSTALASFPPGGMHVRLNTPAGLGLRGLASSGMIQLGRAQNSSNSINDLGKLQQVVVPGNQNGSLLQGMPTSLELDQLQQNKCITRIEEFSSLIDDPTIFPVASGFPNTNVANISSSNSFLSVPNNPFMLQGHPQRTQNRGGFGSQSSVRIASLNPEPFEIGASVSSHLPDLGRCNDNWQSAVQLSGFPANYLPLGDPFNHTNMPPTILRDNISSMATHIGSSQFEVSCTSAVPAPLQVSRREMQSQAGPTGNNVQHDNSKFLNFRSMDSNVGENMNYAPKQGWEDHQQDYTHESNLLFRSSNTSTHGVVGPLGQSFDQNNAVCNRDMDINLIDQSNCGAPFLMQHSEVDKSAIDMTMKLKEEYLLGKTKPQGSFIPNNYGSLEDLMSAMIKRVLVYMMQEQDEGTLMDGDIGCDVYPLGTCM